MKEEEEGEEEGDVNVDDDDNNNNKVSHFKEIVYEILSGTLIKK